MRILPISLCFALTGSLAVAQQTEPLVLQRNEPAATRTQLGTLSPLAAGASLALGAIALGALQRRGGSGNTSPSPQQTQTQTLQQSAGQAAPPQPQTAPVVAPNLGGLKQTGGNTITVLGTAVVVGGGSQSSASTTSTTSTTAINN